MPIAEAQGVCRRSLVFATGTPQNPPFPRAYVHLASTEPTTASDPVSLDIVIDNSKGQGDLFQLAAITDSQAEPLLSKRLVFFGAVGAGTVSTKTAVFETDYRWLDREIPVTLRFVESNDIFPEPVSATIPIRGLPHPDFAVSARGYDGLDQRGLGNSDGILQVTESPEIEVAVMNTGPGKAKKTAVEISGLPSPDDGIQVFGSLQKDVPGLAVGESLTLSFKLVIKPTFKTNKLGFTVTVKEDYFGLVKPNPFTFPIERLDKR